MFPSVVLLLLTACASAGIIASTPSSSDGGVANATLVDIRVAAAYAAYAVYDNSTAGNATNPHSAGGYVDAYDIHDTHFGRYPASEFFAQTPAAAAAGANCGPLEFRQLMSLPGYWPYLDAKVRADLYGKGAQPFFPFGYRSHNTWTTKVCASFPLSIRPSSAEEGCQGPSQTAFSCAGSGPFPVDAGVPAQCDEVEARTSAVVRGTTGRFDFPHHSTPSLALNWLLESSTLSIGTTVSVGFEIKAFSASASTTVETSVTNEESRSVSTTLSTEVTQSLELDAPVNSTCSIEWKVQSCVAVGVAHVPFFATGWVTVEPCYGLEEHACIDKYWYFNLDAIIPAADRNSVMDVSATTRTRSNGNSVSGCTPL
ncbi:hypothetical protein B0H13DRAFT_2679920 [Mycena leptocephala]|nr:hypothetical protein B0H13DRAFT_2679920 [Mycena leptocephala]